MEPPECEVCGEPSRKTIGHGGKVYCYACADLLGYTADGPPPLPPNEPMVLDARWAFLTLLASLAGCLAAAFVCWLCGRK